MFVTKQIDNVIIAINIYCMICKLKKAQVFTISLRNLKYQVKKETRLETDLKTMVLVKYHNFLDVFFKKNLSTPLPY